MSRTPRAACLLLCLLTLAPTAPARAEDRGPSPRRKAEIDVVIAQRRAERQKRSRGAAIRAAEFDRMISEARAYDVNLAWAAANYQMSLERQAMTQGYWLDQAQRRPAQPSCNPPGTGHCGAGLPAYTPAPVSVSLNLPGLAAESPPATQAPPHVQEPLILSTQGFPTLHRQ